MLAQGFAHDFESAGERRIAEDVLGAASVVRPDGGHHRLLGVVSSACALASAAAIAPIELLDRCIASSRLRRSKLMAPDFERLARTP